MISKISKIVLSMMMVLSVMAYNVTETHAKQSKVEVNETVKGVNYYFSTISGNDSNDGKSEAKAFYSLSKVKDLELKPGDQILLENGSTFVGYIHLIDVHGTKEAPIVISNYGKEKNGRPIINTNGEGIWHQDYGTALDNSGHRSRGYVSSSILLYDVDFVTVENLEITNVSDDFDYIRESDKMNMRMDRTGVAGIAKNGGVMQGITLDNLYIHNVDGNIQDKHMNNGGIQMNVLKPDNEALTGIARYEDITIRNNHVKDVSRAGIVMGYTYKHAEFKGAEIKDETATKFGHTNVLIENNYVQNAGNDAIVVMYAYKPLVANNVSDSAGVDMIKYSYWQNFSAAIWPWKTKDAILEYNEVFDTNGTNNGDGQAWDIDWSDGTIYQYNYSHNNGGGAMLICLDEAVRGTLRYNISQNDLKNLITLQGNPNVEIYNNVFYTDGDLDTRVHHANEGKRSGQAYIANNIFYNTSTNNPNDEWEPANNKTFTNNVYFGYDSTPKSDKFAITEDPQFVNAGSAPIKAIGKVHDRTAFEGYKLSKDSPAINAGVRIANNLKDFFGNDVPRVPDIGIYESGVAFQSSDNTIKSTTYMFEEDTLFIPDIKGTNISDEELISNLVVDEEARVEVREVKGEKVVVVIAENGDEREYPVVVKNNYDWVQDFRIRQQGNVWFAQKNENSVYSNLVAFDSTWPNWTGGSYGTVGVDLPNHTAKPTDKTHGLLADSYEVDKETAYSMAYRFPAAGTINFSVKDDEPYIRQAGNANGTVKLFLKLNDEVLQEVELKNSFEKVDFKAMDIDVKVGDILRVETKNIGNPSRNSIHITPNVEYIESAEVEVVVESIEVTTLPDKVDYNEGEELDTTGLVISALKSDGTKVDVTKDVVITLENTEAGVRTYKVTYEGFETTFTVNEHEVVEPTIEKIEVSTLPNKVEYEEGEELDSTGLVVTATKSDGTSVDVTKLVTIELDKIVDGVRTYLVTYEEFTTTFEVTEVKAEEVVVTDIEVTNLPNKVDYLVGEDLDITGLVISAIMSDDSKVNITDEVKIELVNTINGVRTYKVTYNELTTTFEVNEVEVETEVNKDALKSVIDEFLALNAEDYTKESYAAAKAAYEEANAIFTDAEATQEEVDEVTTKLETAIKDLELVDKTEEPKDPEKPVTPDKPKEEDKEKPPTGIANRSAIYVTVIGLALVYLAIRKRKLN